MTNCPFILSAGICPNGATCKHNHSILTCSLCSFVCHNPQEYEVHLKTWKHRQKSNHNAAGRFSNDYYCSACETNIPANVWKVHIGGKKHRARSTRLGLVASEVAPMHAVSTETSTYCSLCRCLVKAGEAWIAHTNGKNHKKKETFVRYRHVLDEAEKDKGGVVVEGEGDLGYLEPPSSTWQGLTRSFTLKTSDASGKCILLAVALSSEQGSRRIKSGFSVVASTLNKAITLRSPATVTFKFNQHFIGQYEDRVEFTFNDTQLAKKFVITRQLRIVVGNRDDHEALKPQTPYVDPRLRAGERARVPVTEVVPGVPPPSQVAVRYISKLPKADIPKNLRGLLSASEKGVRLGQQVGDVRRMFMPRLLASDTYARHFKCLLWVEEHQSDLDLSRYDIPDATLSKHNQYYYLQVPGLAEKRPSVLMGDRMLVQRHGAPSGHWFEGHVHVVRQNEVGLCFHSSFSGWSPSQLYSIRFKLNRTVMKRQHQALDSAFEEERVFFPKETHVRRAPNAGALRINFFNPLIGSNERQSRAVKEIVGLRQGSAPFIVFGPPGTGKTVTIVETIRQLLFAYPAVRILACAPSNSAADLIAERLAATLSPQELFRMYAPSRARSTVPDVLEPYTYTAPHDFGSVSRDCFGVPPRHRLESYTVVVSTCVAASMLAGVGVPRGHFQWVFVDEAGQATEPEVCVSVKTLADQGTNIVLSGDPKQLGPIVRSAVARTLGLDVSWLERLMAMETNAGGEAKVYGEQGQGPGVVKLTQNFRSHEAILKFPNERFYGGDLVPCAPKATTHAFLGWGKLPKSKFPVVFHAVVGKDDREASSPSFFNVDEVLQVKSYVQSLKDGRGQYRINDGEIGVIAPYHAQCLKLKTALRSVADGVKVGSVEEFQGQERKVIIISTVRSSTDFVTYDLRHTLGFVANPRRFNVAVTRAKALLIIVGNPNVLGLDPLWRSFLNYIHGGGGWVGPDIPWDPKEVVGDDVSGEEYAARVRREAQVDMNELTRRMESEVGGELEGDANVDRPWREVE